MRLRSAGPVAVLAGSGELPALVVRALKRAGRDYRVMALRGFADRRLRATADAAVDLLDVRGAQRLLDEWRPAAVTLAGGVKRPRASAALAVLSALRNRSEIAALMARGDDNLLRGVVALFEERGYPVVGAHEIAPELVAGSGPHGRVGPAPADLATMEMGVAVLRALSPFDMGQAVVATGERVLAIEGPEGTDRMLARVRSLRRRWFRRIESGGVLVKAAKSGQDLRVDMPAIGPRTVIHASRAGLSGIAVGAGSTLVINRDETVALADRFGLFVLGIDLPWTP